MLGHLLKKRILPDLMVPLDIDIVKHIKKKYIYELKLIFSLRSFCHARAKLPFFTKLAIYKMFDMNLGYYDIAILSMGLESGTPEN